jgi:hypothetical protein
LSTGFATSTSYWIDRVLSCLGIASSERQECAARASVVLGDVVVLFLVPGFGERSFIIARALVGELPPEGQCESLYQMALEVQGNLCGPHTPMLCLDWPSRVLMVSSQMEISALAADDAARVLLGLRDIALQWREAISLHRVAATPAVGSSATTAKHQESPAIIAEPD